MRTTLNIDSELLEDVLEATGERTKSKAVNTVLKEYIRRKRIKEWIDSWGKIIVDDFSEEAELAEREREAFLNSLGDSSA